MNSRTSRRRRAARGHRGDGPRRAPCRRWSRPPPDRACEIREVPVPSCGPGELLLRVLRAGVCGTDLHIFEWDRWSQGRLKPPVTLGHEFVGEIVERGAGVTNFGVGERVSCESHIVCGTCLACRTGNGHVCENTRILGVDVNGGFARVRRGAGRQRLARSRQRPDRGRGGDGAARQRRAHRVRGAALRLQHRGHRLRPDRPVRDRRRARRRRGARVRQRRLALPARAGAPHEGRRGDRRVARRTSSDRVRELTGGAGSTACSRCRAARRRCATGSRRCATAGGCRCSGLPKEPFELDWNRLRDLQGHHDPRHHRPAHVRDLVPDGQSAVGSGRLDVRPAITHVMPMERFDEAIALLRSGTRRQGGAGAVGRGGRPRLSARTGREWRGGKR